ncbi:hypothetical protein ACJRO7_034513 [Eucalyptus globulus]|uniref:Uncharacterized protein n=1 Tax=Eucalyptus globulus TaxID=34317 RepID=A0ABD3JCV5_EUCGL
MSQNKVLVAFLVLLLAFSLKLQSTLVRQLNLTMQKLNLFPNNKNLHGETLNEATEGATMPPSPGRSLGDFRPTASGHNPGVSHSLQRMQLNN